MVIVADATIARALGNRGVGVQGPGKVDSQDPLQVLVQRGARIEVVAPERQVFFELEKLFRFNQQLLFKPNLEYC